MEQLLSSPEVSRYALIAVAIVILFNKKELKISHAIALVMAYLVIQRLQKDSRNKTDTFIDETKLKWQAIGYPSYFYLDPNFIILFYDILEWRNLNPNNYDIAIKATNNVLQIAEESRKLQYGCVDNYEVAMDQRKLALNMLYAFVHTMDHKKVYQDKLRSVLQRLMVLFERHMDIIRNNCKKLSDENINVNTRFISDAKTFKAYDPSAISGFDIF
jgi:hypothetical protein